MTSGRLHATPTDVVQPSSANNILVTLNCLQLHVPREMTKFLEASYNRRYVNSWKFMRKLALNGTSTFPKRTVFLMCTVALHSKQLQNIFPQFCPIEQKKRNHPQAGVKPKNLTRSITLQLVSRPRKVRGKRISLYSSRTTREIWTNYLLHNYRKHRQRLQSQGICRKL